MEYDTSWSALELGCWLSSLGMTPRFWSMDSQASVRPLGVVALHSSIWLLDWDHRLLSFIPAFRTRPMDCNAIVLPL